MHATRHRKSVATQMEKTVTVSVDRARRIPKYNFLKNYTRKFMAHDENEVCNVGDTVRISP